MYSQKNALRSKPKAKGLHKVLRFRKGVSARRKSRALRKKRPPLHWWNQMKVKNTDRSHWGDPEVSRAKDGRPTRVTTLGDERKKSASEKKMVELAPASALKELEVKPGLIKRAVQKITKFGNIRRSS